MVLVPKTKKEIVDPLTVVQPISISTYITPMGEQLILHFTLPVALSALHSASAILGAKPMRSTLGAANVMKKALGSVDLVAQSLLAGNTTQVSLRTSFVEQGADLARFSPKYTV